LIQILIKGLKQSNLSLFKELSCYSVIDSTVLPSTAEIMTRT